METKIFCFQDSVCLKDTKDATISDELQISFIYSPNMIMTVIKIIITIKVIVTVATNCWVFHTSQVYLQNNLEKWMLFLTSQKGKLKFREKRYYLKQLRHGLFPGYFHVQHTIYVSIQFLEEIEKESESRGGLRELTEGKQAQVCLMRARQCEFIVTHFVFILRPEISSGSK